MANKDFIELMKMEMGFGAPIHCKNCSHSSHHEKDVNSPVEYTCEYATNFTFPVDEDDHCHKWEDL